jgi:hypothetical protein
VHRWETPAGELNLIVSFGDGFRAQARAAANTSNPTPPDQTRGLIGQHRDIGDGRGAVGDRDRHIDACRFLRVRGDLKTADLPTPPGANNVPTDASLSRALPVSALPVGNAA